VQRPDSDVGLFAAGPQAGWEAAGPTARQLSGGPNPTLVDNVETLANVPHILARGSRRRRGRIRHPLAAVIDAVGSGPLSGRSA
jgi:hypothetical protein